MSDENRMHEDIAMLRQMAKDREATFTDPATGLYIPDEIPAKLYALADWIESVATVERERDEAREAFRHYGQHDEDCAVNLWNAGAVACSCGYSDAIRRATPLANANVATPPSLREEKP